MSARFITKAAVKQVLGDYWQQYRRHPWYSAIGFLLPTLGSILVFFVPTLIVARIVDIFIAEGTIALMPVWPLLALFAGLWILGEIFWRIGIHFVIKLETLGIKRLNKMAFDRLMDRDYTFYANNFVGSLSKKGMAFARSFETFTDTMSFRVATNIFPLIFAMVILWRYSFWIPIILFILMAIVIGIAIPIIRSRSHLVAKRHDAGSSLVGRLSDAITNVLAIKSFAKESKERSTYGTYVDKYGDTFKAAADYSNLRLDAVIAPMYVITNVIGLVAAIVFASKFGFEAGMIIVVFSYYSRISLIFWEINHMYRSLESSVSEAAEFTQLFIEPPMIQDRANAKDLVITDARITFNNVSFKYEDEQDKKVSFLENFHLDIKSNQKVGLVGPSGGGKSTITKLLLRFLDIQSGEITFDGQDISLATQQSLRAAIAYVPQEPLLFHRSLFENIAYGNEHATKEEVFAAAKAAHADEFIQQLPKGYETLVGERGIKLSGGQRQRVAIARALLKDAKILVLDEATSALDSESEKYIQEGLFELMKNKTALVIAHRLSTIKHLDRIIVLDQGKIVQDGTHDELVKQKGIYATLWGHQSGEFLS